MGHLFPVGIVSEIVGHVPDDVVIDRFDLFPVRHLSGNRLGKNFAPQPEAFIDGRDTFGQRFPHRYFGNDFRPVMAEEGITIHDAICQLRIFEDFVSTYLKNADREARQTEEHNKLYRQTFQTMLCGLLARS